MNFTSAFQHATEHFDALQRIGFRTPKVSSCIFFEMLRISLRVAHIYVASCLLSLPCDASVDVDPVLALATVFGAGAENTHMHMDFLGTLSRRA